MNKHERFNEIRSWTGEAPAWWQALYVRVTKAESLKVGESIPNQIARAHEIAAQRGWVNYCIYVELTDVSAEWWVEKRPAFKRLVEDIEADRVVAVCARHTDRLWRGDVQSQFLALLRAHRVDLWDFTAQREFKSAHGRFTIQMLSAAGELEVRLGGERIREMKRGKAMKGKSGGGPPAYGYTSQARCMHDLIATGSTEDEAYRQACHAFPVGKTWYVDEREAEAVRLIYHLYTSPEFRYGTKRIARYLNARGYKTRNGLPWLSQYIRRLIANPAYAGFTTFDEASYAEKMPSRLPRSRQARFKGEHPALVSVEQWELAQKVRLTENPTKRTRSQPKASDVFSLTGIIRCPQCNGRMVGKLSNSTAKRYYICVARHSGGVELCNFPCVDAIALQREVWAWLHDILSSPAFVHEHVQRLQAKLEAEVPDAARRLGALERRVTEVRGALSKYFRLLEASDDRERDLALVERVRELRAELQTVEGEAGETRRQTTALPEQKVTLEMVTAYLAALRPHVDDRPAVQRAVFQEFRREHDLRVRPVSKTEFVLSIALRGRELLRPQVPGAKGIERLFAVVRPSTAAQGSEGTGSPTPGIPWSAVIAAPFAHINRSRSSATASSRPKSL